MDHKLYPCFFTQHRPLASSITPAPTQPLPHGSAHGSASEIIQPSTSQSKYLAPLTNGYTKTQSKKKKTTQNPRQANNPSLNISLSEITEVPR